MIILPSVSCGISSSANILDLEASAYISAVEAADGQNLEASARTAINNFVKGCKNDGIWNGIKSCCILAGARTLNGALIPLKGIAPTNNNFITSDYSRTTGLLSDGNFKYLNTNRAHNQDPQDNFHLAVYHYSSSIPSGSIIKYLVGARGPSTCFSSIAFYEAGSYMNIAPTARCSSVGGLAFIPGATLPVGIYAVTRNNNTEFTVHLPAAGPGNPLSSPFNATSITPDSIPNYMIFGLAQSTAPNQLTNAMSARVSFYSIGENIDITLLKSRVNALMSAFSIL